MVTITAESAVDGMYASTVLHMLLYIFDVVTLFCAVVGTVVKGDDPLIGRKRKSDKE